MAIIKTNISEVEEVFAKLDLALICEEKYQSLKQFDWVVYAILKNQEGLSKRSYLMGNKSYVDKYNNVFVRISQKKLAKLLKTSIPTLRNSLNRLVEVDLLEIHVVGQNECNIMYIGNPERTITFGEYIESIGKALEDEDNAKDFKPSINVDNIKDLDNKKASTVPPVKADNRNNDFNNSIPQNEEKDTDKNEKNKESEIVEIINNSCVNIRKQDLKKCEEEFTDIDKLKKALEICEIDIANGKKSHGIKALRLAYKYGDRSSNTNADNDKRKGSIYMADSKVDVNGELKSVEDMSSEDIAYKLDLKNGTNWSGRNPNAKGIFKDNF